MIIPAVKLACLNKEACDNIRAVISDWGIRTEIEIDGDNIFVIAYDVSDSELVNLRGLVTLKNVTSISIIGLHEGRRIVREITDTVVIPAIKDIVSNSFAAKDYVDKTINDIKKHPRESGDWNPLKLKLSKIKLFAKRG